VGFGRTWRPVTATWRAAWVAAAALACGLPGGGARPAAPGPAPSGRGGPRDAPLVMPQESGTTQGLVGIRAVSERVAWASGRGGTYLTTDDGGAHWRVGVVPGAEALQFRDVDAVDARTAWLLAIGPAESSRIYHTADGGLHWALQYVNRDPAAFYDCFAFRDARRAIAVGDAVRGRIPILRTADAGAHWVLGDTASLPAADSGEGSLAASGTCVAVRGRGRAWIATSGGARGARVLASSDGGATWRAAATPFGHGTRRAALATLAFRDARLGFAGGGDSLGAAAGQIARTDDGGRSWRLVAAPGMGSPVYGLAVVPGVPGALVAVGPGGAAYSRDDGASWAPLVAGDWWAVAFAGGGTGWLVGTRGRIVKVTWR
jgi:photosystem II stability/assembly factor-like uncharacterized protein